MEPRVVIIGGSYAGLAAGLQLQRAGIQPIIIERNEKPLAHSTGGIANAWFKKDMALPPEECVSAQVRAFRITSPNGKVAEFRAEKSMGAVLNIEKYLDYYVDEFKQNGGELIAPATFVRMQEGYVLCNNEGNLKTVKADIVIGADGATSQVRHFMNLDGPKPEDMHLGYEETLPNITGEPGDMIQIIIDEKIAPLGYAWIFADSDGKNIRLGLGVPKSTGQNPKVNFYTKLLEKFPDLKKGERLKVVAGQIPTAPLPQTNSYAFSNMKVLFVGDAGNFCSVHPDELVYSRTPDGIKILPISEIREGWEVGSLNLATLKIEFMPVSRVIKHTNNRPLLEVVVESGRRIRVTPDHSLMVYKNEKIQSIPTNQLQIGDYVLAPRNLPTIEQTDIPPELAKLMGLYLAEGYVKKKSKKNPWHLRLTFGLNDPAFDEALQCCNVLSLKTRVDKAKWKQTLSIYNEWGDARSIPIDKLEQIHNLRASGLSTYEIAKETKLTQSTVWRYIRGYRKRIPRRNTVNLLEYEWSSYATKKRVPSIIFNCNEVIKREFLSGYWLGDGSTNKWTFSFTTASKDLAHDLIWLFDSINIRANISEAKIKPKLIVGKAIDGSTYSIQQGGTRYFVNVPFTQKHSYTDCVPLPRPIEPKSTRISRQRFKQFFPEMNYLANSEILFLKVKKISEVESPEFVYDLSIPGHENFAVGNLLGHNSNLHGGGIGFGILSGILAADAIITKGFNCEREYTHLWQAQLAPILRRHTILKKVLYGWKPENFDKAVEALGSFKVDPESDPQKIVTKFLWHLLRHYPSLVPKFAKSAL